MTAGTRAVLAAVGASMVLGFLGMSSGIGPSGVPGQAVSGPEAGQPGDTFGDQAVGSEAAGDTTAQAGISSSAGAGGAQSGPAASTKNLECKAGRNGGNTDKGVTSTKIRLASTVVLDGPAASLLSTSPTAMKAVVDKVNSGGGICGRLLDLTVVNDSFRSDRGQQFLQNFINDPTGYFALSVVPSAEGLGAAILAKDIASAKIPVVGSDGMRVEQYNEPWVWPVAAATVSTMRIMASYGAKSKGAKTFAIVWDSKYKFGREGADAFKDQVQKLGGTIAHDQPLDPDQAGYANEVDGFNNKCKANACDMVAMLLLPDTAQKWMSRRPEKAKLYTAGAQTLFTDEFARQCSNSAGLLCHGVAIWTGYNPPIDRYATLPDVAAYVDDVRAVSPNADVKNQFTEGAYLGMRLLVEAFGRVGPNLTRERLRATLDAMDYSNQITSGLSWRAGKHYANTKARAFSMVVSGSNFVGWRDEQTDWVTDPAFGG